MSRISTRTIREKDLDRKWFIREPEIEKKSETVHLGIIRSEKNENSLNESELVLRGELCTH